MNLRNLIRGILIVGGVSICIAGGLTYQYISKLKKETSTYVLPNTSFDGTALDGKTKQEVQQMIKEKVNKLNHRTITFRLGDSADTYTWEELGVQYKGTDIAEQIFKEQEGSIIERYTMRKQAENGQLKREYHLEAYLDSAKYETFMKDKYNELLSKPSNASLSITGTNITITPSKDGKKVDKQKLKALTEEAIQKPKTTIEVPVIAVKPERTTEDIQNMGIKEVIAEYRTPLTGRNANQVFNISRAARKLSGALIAPDEMFSFKGRVGLTNAENGYKSAAVYVNGTVQESAGGGVCQVSSTLYGAILRADLSIVERSNHSLPVYYVPLGQDAAIADYGPDLKFKNNTGHYIYVQAGVENHHMVVRIFGTNTGKSVTVSSKIVSETNKNIVVVTYKTVTQNGKVIQSGQLHKSTYKKTA
jgi:vancomycin resistance protein YoaR